jgi:hypothetical protein
MLCDSQNANFLFFILQIIKFIMPRPSIYWCKDIFYKIKELFAFAQILLKRVPTLEKTIDIASNMNKKIKHCLDLRHVSHR